MTPPVPPGNARPTSTVVAIVLSGAFVVGVLGGGGFAWSRHQQTPVVGPQPGPASAPVTPPTESPSPSPESSSPVLPTQAPSSSPTPTTPTRAELEATASAELKKQAKRDRDLGYINGQWVAQMSSKYDGVTDPYQQTADGSHRFRTSDILAEHEHLRIKFGDDYTVLLIRGQDWGSGQTVPGTGATYWNTFIDGAFGSRSDVADFCADQYPDYSGTKLADFCFPRRLVPRS